MLAWKLLHTEKSMNFVANYQYNFSSFESQFKVNLSSSVDIHGLSVLQESTTWILRNYAKRESSMQTVN